MKLRAPAIVLCTAAFILAACDDGSRSYPVGRADSEYDLPAMALSLEDVPRGFTQTEITQPPESPAQFNNERWALIIDSDDADAVLSQLRAQGRLNNYVTAFGPGGLGPVLSLTSISTLYTDAAAATASVERFACGLPLENSVALEGFAVPKVGDGSAGFFVRQRDDQGNPTFVDTTICFRTGRVIHAIQQTSVAGTEDVALSVRLANRMLERINAAFDAVDDEG